MNKAIKLYSKINVSWKCETIEEATEELKAYNLENIKHEIQKPTASITITKRKLKPYDVEISYYSFEKIQEIINDNKIGVRVKNK